VSNNYFDKRWSGARRIKNVVMVLEWTPTRAQVAIKPARNVALDDKQNSAFDKAFHLFDQDNSGDLNEEEFKQMTRSTVDYIPLPSDDELKRIMHQFAQGKESIDYNQTVAFLQSGLLRPEESGRYYVTVSLAEAETIRRIMHMRLEREIIDGANVAIALRCAAVPASSYLRTVPCAPSSKPYAYSLLRRTTS
jgi:hypothetical protein